MTNWRPGKWCDHPKTQSKKRCLREADGPVNRAEAVAKMLSTGGKVVAWVRLENCACEAGEEPEDHNRKSRNKSPVRCRGDKISPLNGFNPIRAKTPKNRRRRRGVYESFWSRHRSQKFLRRTINLLEFGKFVKIYYRIIELQHLIDPRRMLLLKERYAE